MELKVRYSNIGSDFGDRELEALRQLFETADSMTYGPMRDEFENRFAELVGTDYAISCNSGTSALHIVTQALGIGPTDEVITTPLTFVATGLPVLQRRARLVFCDIEADTLNIDARLVEENITSRTKAIYVVHYGGQCVDMDPVLEVAERHGITVIEDAATAIGSTYKGRSAGSMGYAACFSFQTLKTISTLGEGGMITTNDAEFAQKCRRLRNIGLDAPQGKMKEEHPWQRYDLFWTNEYLGNNLRLNEAQAAVGLVQLSRLNEFVAKRQELAKRYDELLSRVPGILLPGRRPDRNHVFQLYTIQLAKHLEPVHRSFLDHLYYDEGIEFVLQVIPMYLLTAFKESGYRPGVCPVAESCYRRLVSLPIYPRMTFEDVETVATGVRRALQSACSEAGWSEVRSEGSARE